MKQFWLTIKIFAALFVCIVVAICTLFTMHMMGKKIPRRFERMFTKVVPETDSYSKNNSVEAEKMLEIAEMPDLDPGDKAFQKASELLALGKIKEGRDKLNYLLEYFPSSPVAPRAKRILSVMQMDDFLSIANNPRIIMHKVQRGDSYFALVNKYETTMDCMIYVNGFSDLHALQPGDELLFLPLKLLVTIDASKKVITLWDNGKFVADYPILSLSGIPKNPIKSKVENKIGILEGKKIAPTAKQYRAANKSILLNGNYTITTKPDDVAAFAKGFYLSAEDMEDLSLLLRVGNEVEIRP